MFRQVNKKCFFKNSSILVYVIFLFCITLQISFANIQWKIFHYKIDIHDNRKFGYIQPNEGVCEGPLIISVWSHYAFITDAFHSNIKKIDLNSGKLFSSRQLGINEKVNRSWIRDVNIFGNNVFVTSDLDSIFILDINLKYKKGICVSRGVKRIVIQGDSLLYVYNWWTKEKLFFEKNGELVSIMKNEEEYLTEPWQRKYSIDSTKLAKYLNYDNKSILLSKSFYTVQGSIDDAENIAWNDKFVTYFLINNRSLNLYILKL